MKSKCTQTDTVEFQNLKYIEMFMTFNKDISDSIYLKVLDDVFELGRDGTWFRIQTIIGPLTPVVRVKFENVEYSRY